MDFKTALAIELKQSGAAIRNAARPSRRRDKTGYRAYESAINRGIENDPKDTGGDWSAETSAMRQIKLRRSAMGRNRNAKRYMRRNAM